MAGFKERFKNRRTSENVHSQRLNPVEELLEPLMNMLGKTQVEYSDEEIDFVKPAPWHTVDYGGDPGFHYDVWTGKFKHSPTLDNPKATTNWQGSKYPFPSNRNQPTLNIKPSTFTKR